MIMTYEKTVKLCLLAETRLKKRISAIAMAKQLRGPTATQRKKEKEPSDKDSDSKDKKKEDMRKPPKKDTDTVEGKWLKLPYKIKNLTAEQGEALTKVCYERGVCKNCAETDKTFPTHKSWQCPYENRWGGKWPDRHDPVKPVSTVGEKR